MVLKWVYGTEYSKLTKNEKHLYMLSISIIQLDLLDIGSIYICLVYPEFTKCYVENWVFYCHYNLQKLPFSEADLLRSMRATGLCLRGIFSVSRCYIPANFEGISIGRMCPTWNGGSTVQEFAQIIYRSMVYLPEDITLPYIFFYYT